MKWGRGGPNSVRRSVSRPRRSAVRLHIGENPSHSARERSTNCEENLDGPASALRAVLIRDKLAQDRANLFEIARRLFEQFFKHAHALFENGDFDFVGHGFSSFMLRLAADGR